MKDVEIISRLIIIDIFIHIYSFSKGDNLLAKRKNEKFKRIKCSTLAKLLQE
jgi:hypothetical protein